MAEEGGGSSSSKDPGSKQAHQFRRDSFASMSSAMSARSSHVSLTPFAFAVPNVAARRRHKVRGGENKTQGVSTDTAARACAVACARA